MSGFIASVDARTQLAGHNRLELLLFRLGEKQRFGINVFKVREVIQCPPLTQMPKSHMVVRGIINIRGTTMSVMDLSMAVGMPAIEDTANSFLVITEFNRKVQGFLVSSVDRIVNHNWKDILPPPKGHMNSSYLTAVTHLDGELVEILDVERVLAEVVGAEAEVSEEVTKQNAVEETEKNLVLIVDDSVVARNQVKRTAIQLGLEVALACDGAEALQLLEGWADNNSPEISRLALIISDIEMPIMDGYTLTTLIRRDQRINHFRILLHTSMSGGFNQAMVDKVGADEFIAKFDPDILAAGIGKHVSQVHKITN